MKKEQRDMSMVLVKFTNGPMGGEEREVQSADTLVSEYPGYAPTEQVMDPEHGQCLTVRWTGEAATEAAYDNKPGVPDSEATGAETRKTKSEEKPQVKDRRDAK